MSREYKAEIIKCDCGNVICVRSPAESLITVKHHGRIVRIGINAILIITCERCGKDTLIAPREKEKE